MKKIPSHLFLFLLPALLLFNWLWKIIYDLANQQAPNSANIPSGSFHQLWQYVLENKNQYIINLCIRIVVILLSYPRNI